MDFYKEIAPRTFVKVNVVKKQINVRWEFNCIFVFHEDLIESNDVNYTSGQFLLTNQGVIADTYTRFYDNLCEKNNIYYLPIGYVYCGESMRECKRIINMLPLDEITHLYDGEILNRYIRAPISEERLYPKKHTIKLNRMPIDEFIKLALKCTLSESFIEGLINANKKHALLECLLYLYNIGVHLILTFETPNDFISLELKYVLEYC